MQYNLTRHIAAPREKVFELLSDDEKMKQWIPELVANVYPNGKNINDPVGTKFIQKLKEGGRTQAYEGEVITYKLNDHLGIRLGNHAFSVDVHYRLHAEGAATKLEYSCAVEYKGWFYRMIGKMFFGFMRKMSNKQMDRLKELAES